MSGTIGQFFSDPYINAAGNKPVDNPVNGEFIKHAQHPIGDAISVMLVMMALLQNLANDKLANMQKKSDISRSAQEMANQVESALARITTATGDGSTTDLDPKVVQYLRDNHILVDNQSIDQYLANAGAKDGKNHTDGKGLTKDMLISIKGSLSSVSDRASDFLQQTQLKMQQVMQNYNTAVQMINSLQSMLSESVKGIASAIR